MRGVLEGAKVELIEFLEDEGYDLKWSGSSCRMLCPFHTETNASLHLYKETNSFYCFSCRRGGGIVSFLMYRDGLSYQEALKVSGQEESIEGMKEELLNNIQSKGCREKSEAFLLKEISVKIRDLMTSERFEEAKELYESVVENKYKVFYD